MKKLFLYILALGICAQANAGLLDFFESKSELSQTGDDADLKKVCRRFDKEFFYVLLNPDGSDHSVTDEKCAGTPVTPVVMGWTLYCKDYASVSCADCFMPPSSNDQALLCKDHGGVDRIANCD